MRFVKMHGTGNDYVYVDCFREPPPADPAGLARLISHRHFGVGGDGLILVKPAPNADAAMEMYNADGSRSEMCGNGLRCVAKLVFDRQAPDRDELRILTGKGVLTVKITSRNQDDTARELRIDMGPPILEGADIPVNITKNPVLRETLQAAGQTWEFSSVGMGNPHCVIFPPSQAATREAAELEMQRFPLESVGPAIENHPLFPRRVNVEFVWQTGTNELLQRTWERGAGETWACGTGACAVAVAARLLGRTTGEQTRIHLTGGQLLIAWDGSPAGHVFLTGNAVTVFEGDWPAGAD